MKKKILIFLFVFIVMLMPVLTYADDTYVLPDLSDYMHYVVTISEQYDISGKYLGKKYYLFATKDEGMLSVIIAEETGNPNNPYYFPRKTRECKIYKSSSTDGINWSDFEVAYGATQTNRIIQSTYNVYDKKGTLFFSPPQPPIPVLVETMGAVDSGTLLRNISAGLIPLIGLIVSAICLKKGWGFLRRQLTT